MFGLFKKKKFDFDCPMCGKSYSLKFDPSQITEFEYQYRDGAGYVGKQACEFCKTEMTIVLLKYGKIEAIDEKWEKVENEHNDKIDIIYDEISEIEEQIEENPDNQALKKKLKQSELKKAKLEDSSDKKIDRYSDRQANWQDKWQNKLERM